MKETAEDTNAKPLPPTELSAKTTRSDEHLDLPPSKKVRKAEPIVRSYNLRSRDTGNTGAKWIGWTLAVNEISGLQEDATHVPESHAFVTQKPFARYGQNVNPQYPEPLSPNPQLAELWPELPPK